MPTPQYTDQDYLEQVYAALFALLKSAQFTGGLKFNHSARVLVLPDQVAAVNQPALYLYQGPVRVEQKNLYGPSKETFTAIAIIFLRGDGSGSDKSATNANYLIWGLKQVFATMPPYQKQTLGGIVHHCWIEGDIVPETLDQQIVITIPIHILTN